MIRTLIALPFAALLATQAFAADATKITNNSGLPIDELFSAAPGTKDWGKNILDGVAEGALDSGKSVEIAGAVVCGRGRRARARTARQILPRRSL